MTIRIGEHPLVALVGELVPSEIKTYLIGGAIRDEILHHTSADFDFSLSQSALHYARKIANRLGAAYFPLDLERQVGRVLWKDDQGFRYKMDFSLLRGESLLEDLQGRDFTINALALDVHHPEKIEDPLGGAQDLLKRVLRVCSERSMEEDPLRVLRGIRFAASLGLEIPSSTWGLMKTSARHLERVSAERIRDEVYHILRQEHTSLAIELLDKAGALEIVFPELRLLKGIKQSPPHYLDVYQHTLKVIQNIEQLCLILTQPPDTQWQANLISGMTSQTLGRYREEIRSYLAEEIIPERARWGLLKLAALYHDCGKVRTQQFDDNGRIHFYGHEELSAELASKRMSELTFANTEIEWVSTVIRNHMRPINLGILHEKPSPKTIYRFYRDAGEAGVAIGLLSLADVLGAFGTAMTADNWQYYLAVVRSLFEAWWEQKQEVVKPSPLLNGNELMAAFNLPSGPQIGRLLEAIKEAQVSGEVTERQQAIELAKRLIAQG